MSEKRYEEIGSNYRYFLGWRHAAFAANIIVLWGMAQLLIKAYMNARPLTWLIPLLASPIGFLLWIADKRTRQIYRKLIKAGKKLEPDGVGSYTELDRISIPLNAKWFPRRDEERCKLYSQSTALTWFFLGSSLALLFLSIYLKFFMPGNPAGSP